MLGLRKMEINQFPKPRKGRRNRKYLAFGALHPCIYCGAHGPNQAHHDREIGPCGMGSKPSDSYIVPICPSCHDHLHNKSREYHEMSLTIGREERMAVMIELLDEWLMEKGI